MNTNPLLRLEAFGQSVWLDSLSREMLRSGELQQLVTNDGLSGVTSNPKIFHDSITGSDVYEEAIQSAGSQSPAEVFESLALADIREAADRLRHVYESTGGTDGFVSMEVNPHLASDTEGTILEARRFWKALSRPNVLIKVPATRAGVPAIRQLVEEGININVTLLFGLDRYREVALAYIDGLEKRAASGNPVSGIASVASFFLSRIDVLVDRLLEDMIRNGGSEGRLAESLHGTIAVSNAKMAYGIYKEIFNERRFRDLAAKGARPQKLLWASTGTKNPNYSDIRYVEPLIGPATINTMTRKTLDAYRNHGRPANRLETGVEEAAVQLRRLEELGISSMEVSRELEREGVRKFSQPYDELIESLEDRLLAHTFLHR